MFLILLGGHSLALFTLILPWELPGPFTYRGRCYHSWKWIKSATYRTLSLLLPLKPKQVFSITSMNSVGISESLNFKTLMHTFVQHSEGAILNSLIYYLLTIYLTIKDTTVDKKNLCSHKGTFWESGVLKLIHLLGSTKCRIPQWPGPSQFYTQACSHGQCRSRKRHTPITMLQLSFSLLTSPWKGGPASLKETPHLLANHAFPSCLFCWL